MDADFNIYSDDPEKIPAEDKARLEGYVKALREDDDDRKVRLEALGSRPEILVDGADEETTRAVAKALDDLMRRGS